MRYYGPASAHYSKRDKAALVAAMDPIQDVGGAAAELERQLAYLAGCDPHWVVATNSCTSALMLSGLACDTLLPGKRPLKVGAPIYTWPGTYAWTQMFPDRFQLELRDLMTGTHPANGSADIEILAPLGGTGLYAPPYGQTLWSSPAWVTPGRRIIDAAHCLPTMSNLGSMLYAADFVCLSFYDTKTVAGIRGGAMLANQRRVPLETMAHLRHLIRSGVNLDKGRQRWSDTPLVGMNLYMPDQNADVILPQLRDRSLALTERKLHTLYTRYASCAPPGMTIYGGEHLAIVETTAPNELRRRIAKLSTSKVSVFTGRGYPLKDWYYSDVLDRYPKAHRACNRVITLPFGVHLPPAIQAGVCQVLQGLD